MYLEDDIIFELQSQGADFVHFVDISQLSFGQNKGYSNAILIGIALSVTYLQKVTNLSDYEQEMIHYKQINNDEFHLKEIKTDELADYIADYLTKKGYSSYSQSEKNIYQTGFYDVKTKSTPLPHKTIALLAGIGWIGKHNLLISSEFGSAISMCTVLTNASLNTVLHAPHAPQCGNCEVCKNICPVKAIEGNDWNKCISRDELINVYECNTCLKCLVFCPWTQAYMKKNKAVID